MFSTFPFLVLTFHFSLFIFTLYIGVLINHSFFGVTGANNYINVLDNSSLFDDILDDVALSSV